MPGPETCSERVSVYVRARRDEPLIAHHPGYPRPPIRGVDTPEELAEVFAADRETHVYGLADLEEPYWSNSRWFHAGPAVVGVVSVGDDWQTIYAMSRTAPEETLELLSVVQESVPPGTWVTGPLGLHASISQVRRCRDVGLHWRMILGDVAEISGSREVVTLTESDIEAVRDLYASDEGRAFFLPAMLVGNPFAGIWEGEKVVAAAGTHVASKMYGVAAVGAVITRPSHRGRGLGTIAVAELCRRLVEEYETVGLNVETVNEPALRIYDHLGFHRAFQYEEIELL